MRQFIFASILLILIPSVFSATIEGNVYEFSLDKVEDAIIEINTVPAQKIVSKDSSFSFNVPIGNYVIKAEADPDEGSVEESIVIKDDGVYHIDLVLFPSIADEKELEDDPVLLDDDILPESFEIPAILLSIVIIGCIAVVAWRYKKRHLKKHKSVLDESLSDGLSSKIFDYIKANKRLTQKDIRKQFPMSEAKISLVLAELEHKGFITKIKKGRANIVILK